MAAPVPHRGRFSVSDQRILFSVRGTPVLLWRRLGTIEPPRLGRAWTAMSGDGPGWPGRGACRERRRDCAADVWRAEQIALPEIAGTGVLVRSAPPGSTGQAVSDGGPAVTDAPGGLRRARTRNRVRGPGCRRHGRGGPPEVTRFAAGNEVFGIRRGSLSA
jgi:hypothetical protein